MLVFDVKQAQRNFLDREAIIKRFAPDFLKSATKVASFIRTAARRSMRRAGKNPRKSPPSPPGQPPRARLGYLRDFLFFAFDLRSNTIVVGPARLGNSKVPGLHEFGGVQLDNGALKRYPPRPYMVPALRLSQDKLRSLS